MTWMMTFCLALMSLTMQASAAEPIHITAEHMRMNTLQQHATFSGGVHVTRGDFQLWSDKLVVFYQKQHIQKAIADGRVRITQNNKRGASNHAVFQNKQNMLTLTGQASVENEQGVIRGETIEYHIDTQETIVSQGAHQPVRLHIEDEGSTQP